VDRIRLAGFFLYRQHLAIGEAQVAVAAHVVGEGVRRAAIQCLEIQLLIALVDEHQAVVHQAERTATVFVHPAAHAETIRRQAPRLAVLPLPDAAGSVAGTVFGPEHPGGADAQFGEIGSGGDRLCGAERLSFLR